MIFYDNIALEKGMYNSEKSFSTILESLDPSVNYKGSDIEGLDAYERQLKRFDIKVKGFNSDNVSKFFQSTASATLFPEYVKRCVLSGIGENYILKDIIATNTKINSGDYRPITVVSSGDSNITSDFSIVETGGLIPSTEIKQQTNLIALKKRGRMMVSSYEAIKFQRLDLFAVALKQMGIFIAKSQIKDAVDVIINGDGNTNPAKSISVATAKTLTYADLIKLWSEFTDFEMNRLLVSPDVMAQMLNLSELKDPVSGVNFQGTGKLTTPFGASLYSTTSVPAGKIIALDKNCSLEMITASDVSIDSDKLIDRQLERAAITSINGFAKIFKEAAVVMSV